MSQRIVLAPEVRAAMIAHAARELPREAVGLLGGRDGVVSLVCELVNVAGERAFLADPRSQFEAERRVAQAGLTVLAIYHSHPGGGAALSASDVHFGRRRDVVQVVIALGGTWRDGHELRAFRLDGARVEAVEVSG